MVELVGRQGIAYAGSHSLPGSGTRRGEGGCASGTEATRKGWNGEERQGGRWEGEESSPMGACVLSVDVGRRSGPRRCALRDQAGSRGGRRQDNGHAARVGNAGHMPSPFLHALFGFGFPLKVPSCRPCSHTTIGPVSPGTMFSRLLRIRRLETEAPGWLVPRSSLVALSIPRDDYLALKPALSVQAGRGTCGGRVLHHAG